MELVWIIPELKEGAQELGTQSPQSPQEQGKRIMMAPDIALELSDSIEESSKLV